MAVTANQTISRQDGDIGGGPALTAITFYTGTMAFIDAANGYVTNIINSGANKFAGIVRDYVDNSAGASGATSVNLYQEGSFVLVGSGFTQADVGKKVYATDNYVIGVSATSTTYIGTCTKYISATKLEVKIDVQLP